MALEGFCLHYSPPWNPPPVDLMKDKFIRAQGLVESSNSGSASLTLEPIPSYDPTPVPASNPVPAPTLVSFNELFKQFIKVYLKFNQRLNQPPVDRKQLLKVKFQDVYYGRLHIDCYHFCQ